MRGSAAGLGLVILAVVLGALLIFGDDGPILGLDPDDFAQLGYLSALAVVIAASALAWRGRQTGIRLWHAALWLAILVALMAGYQAWHAGDLPLPIIPTGPVTNV